MITGLFDSSFWTGAGYTLSGAGWFTAGTLGGRAARRRVRARRHLRHDPAWAATLFTACQRDQLARTVSRVPATTGMMSRQACHGQAWMMGEYTPDGPVITTGHARSKKAADKVLAAAQAEAVRQVRLSGDRHRRLAEHDSERPGE